MSPKPHTRRLLAGTILASLIAAGASSPACATWLTNGNPLAVLPNSQASPAIVSDGASGAIVAWTSIESNGATNVYAQRVDSSGVVHWSVGGVPVSGGFFANRQPTLAAVSNHGAVILWTRTLVSADLASGDLYAQRLDSLGIAQWAANGIPIANTGFGEFTPLVVPNGSSGTVELPAYYVAYNRYSPTPNFDAWIQRVEITGSGLWQPSSVGGLKINPAGTEAVVDACIADGVGTIGRARGAFVAWENLSSLVTSADIVVQRVTPTGTFVFPSGGVAVCSAPGPQQAASIALVGGGNAVVAWSDQRTSTAADIYAQKINTSGAVQWLANGLPVCRAPGVQGSPHVFADNAGGAIVTWFDRRSGVDMIYAQRIDPSGQPLWTLDGIPVTSAVDQQNGLATVSDGAGGVIVTWGSGTFAGGGQHHMQRIDGNGNLMWGPQGVAFDSSPGTKITPVLVSDNAFGAIAAWEDRRADPSLGDIYAFRMTPTLAVLDVPLAHALGVSLSRTSANPTTRGATFRLQLAARGCVVATIHDLQGRLVKSLAAGETLEAGAHTLAWDGDDDRGAAAAPGVYLVRLRAGGASLSGRIVVVR